MPADIDGILLLDKPVGLSSAGAVARVKRLFDARKAGHTGSLDPLASGLLPICFGEATKFSAQLLEADKTYRVTARLGTIAHLAALRRLGVAPFGAEPQWSLEALESMSPAQRREVLLPVDAALTGWRRLDLSLSGVIAFRQGQTLVLTELAIPAELPESPPETVRIYAAGLGFLGLGQVQPAGRLVPLRLISAATNRA